MIDLEDTQHDQYDFDKVKEFLQYIYVDGVHDLYSSCTCTAPCG